MADSPSIRSPFSSSAHKRTSTLVAGTTWPWTARTRLEAVIAVSKLPVIAVKADRKRFPKLCPSSPLPEGKRYWKSPLISGSSVAKAAKQFLMSPGGWTPSSLLRTPLLPPSSATVTIAVIRLLYLFKPFNNEDKPVPPPIATIFGPLFNFCLALKASVSYTHLTLPTT